MVVVRNCFTAKPGSASKLAAMMKAAFAAAGIPNHRVLTDLTGDFNRVIVEFEAADAGAAEATIREYRSSAAFRELMAGYTDLWITGSREILRIVE
jgi:hypothetical protein